jgi:hypothetical protein
MNRKWSLTEDFKFTYNLTEFDTVDTNNYVEAIEKTVKLVRDDFTKLNLHKVALCLSGSDSELIAHFLHKNFIPTEYFFLDINGINSVELDLCKKIAAKYNTKLNVISITEHDLLNTIIYENFHITHVCWPTYVTLPYLIKQIPSDFYIITGEGDIEKGWPRYLKIYEQKIKTHDDNYFYIPVHLTEISYSLSMSYYGKNGESNFYSRCFDIWYHILKDPRLITDGKCMFDPKTNIISEIRTQLNLLSPSKTMNYQTGYEVRMKIRKKIIEYGQTFPGWDPIIGDVIQIPKFIINNHLTRRL